MTRICILLQKLNAELKRINDNVDGGGMSVIIMGLTGFFIVTLIFLSVADVSIYSYKKRVIGVALDYAVSAAVQEIDTEKSKAGLARAFSDEGEVCVSGIYFNGENADNAFKSTVTDNLSIDVKALEDKMIRIMATPESDSVYYNIKDKMETRNGYAENIEQIEKIINERADSLGSTVDRNKVYVNGNAASNFLEKRPYYMVFIRDYQIDGLITHKKATFICFKAGKIYR